jgi:hypothetical protein
MYKINYVKPKIRDLRALAEKYNKLTKAKRVLYFVGTPSVGVITGWYFDYGTSRNSWRLGAHVSDSFPVLDEHIAEYEMSVGKGER